MEFLILKLNINFKIISKPWSFNNNNSKMLKL